jgi:hypothetical protein
MKIVVICPVRAAEPGRTLLIKAHIAGLRDEGHTVFSYWDTPMEACPTGAEILFGHLGAMVDADVVHVFWDETSRGCHFELGTAVALNKFLVIKRIYGKLPEGQSYMRALLENYQKIRLRCALTDLGALSLPAKRMLHLLRTNLSEPTS